MTRNIRKWSIIERRLKGHFICTEMPIPYYFLPGGTGSISELFAMLEEHRTIENPKEIILYNQNGYYAWVLELLAKLVQMGFNDTSIFSHIKVFNEQSDVLRYLKEKIKKKEG